MSEEKKAPVIKDMAGYFAKNTSRANDRQPNWRGKVRIEGKEYLLSGWDKAGTDGLMNISVTDPASLPPRPTSPGQGSNPAGGAPASGSSASSPTVSDPFGDIFGALPGS